ncbi:MAG: acetoacetate decarboxylase family protein [Actinobacteria bacterium]|nr:acetoacetate decarboxylase family protein [Actinomycetota bacterium]
MYTGTKSVDELASRAPTMASLDAAPVTLEHVEIVTVVYEVAAHANEAVLPPGLHPTMPPVMTWSVWRCGDSPWGPFAMAQARIECRSGMRPRGFLVSAVVDSDDAAAALTEGWGYACRPGTVTVDRSYDRASVRVAGADGTSILEIEVVDPVTLRTGDIQWIANMHLAHTPMGLRLIQVDPDVEVHRAERARPRVVSFDAAAWGEPLLEPVYPVAASLARASVTLPKLRYVCAPDQLAFFSTEVIA